MDKIDFIIPWVDGSDPVWQAQHDAFAGENHENSLKKWNDSKSRYRDWDLLRYWFRGVERFAPWVNRVHFVTCGQLPQWLNKSNPKLHLVNHRDYIPEEYLPTFSSHCIELNMHRIPELADNFVYFNDDTFLAAPTNQEDFFRCGLPRDCAVVQPIRMEQNGIRAEINDMYVINEHFTKKNVISKNLRKWFSPSCGKLLIHTLLMLPYSTFPGFYISHLPVAYRKQTLEEVWAACPEVLHTACTHRFRTSTDVNQWLFQYWQFAKGAFIPRRHTFGRTYEGAEFLNQVCKDIAAQKYSVICWNDSNDFADFEAAKAQIQAAFETILPERCGFEN